MIPDSPYNRRQFLKQSSLLAAASIVMPFGCKEAVPKDIRITRIVQFELRGKRPKYVGKNARIDDHTEYGRDKGIRVFTDAGLDGIGTCWADEPFLRSLLGKNLLDWYQPETPAISIQDRGTGAFWDILGKYYEKPIWQLLGSAQRETIPVYDGTIYFQDLLPQFESNYMDQFKKEFDIGMEAGHNFFKMKVGRGGRWMEKEAGYERDIEVLAACREYLGPDIQIGVDANNGLDLPSTKQMLQDLPAFNFAFMEEMFPEELALDIELHKFIQENGWKTLVADGESQKEIEAFGPFLEAGCIDVMQGDMNQFGIEGILAEAKLGEAYGAQVAPHNWGSILGYYTQVHLGKIIPNWYCAELDSLSTPALTPEGFNIKNGHTTVTESPGLGLRINDEAFEREASVLLDLKV